jgi:hypothetical protein
MRDGHCTVAGVMDGITAAALQAMLAASLAAAEMQVSDVSEVSEY